MFGYYSGPSARFESHFARHQEKFYRQLLENAPDQALRPLFYARLIHAQFVLLSFFYAEQDSTAHFLREYLGIEDLESILFVLKQPPWKGDKDKGDARFWFAKGAVQVFLDRLFASALAPIRLKQRIDVDLIKKSTQERLYLYLKDRPALQHLRNDYRSPADFFKALESTYLSKLLAEVRIRVRIRDFNGSLTFRELSEGEQQLLTVLGLLRFTRDEEALFLLDEPDTHLNPIWSLHYLDLLNEVVGEQKTSQILLTTHDPLTIAGLTRNQVRVMVKDQSSHVVSARVPDQDPKGMGVSGILTSDLFGLRSDLDLETLKLLDEKRDLAVKENLTERDKQRLVELRDELKDLDMSTRVRDPLFREFVRALTTNEEFRSTQQDVLTPAQVERRRDLALQTIAEVKQEMQKDEEL